jgi:hypothetical protein
MEYQKLVNVCPRTSIERLLDACVRAHNALVAIGAWTTIAVVAFNPFVQQLVGYRSELVSQNDPGAKVALAQQWSRGTELLAVTFHFATTVEKGALERATKGKGVRQNG